MEKDTCSSQPILQLQHNANNDTVTTPLNSTNDDTFMLSPPLSATISQLPVEPLLEYNNDINTSNNDDIPRTAAISRPINIPSASSARVPRSTAFNPSPPTEGSSYMPSSSYSSAVSSPITLPLFINTSTGTTTPTSNAHSPLLSQVFNVSSASNSSMSMNSVSHYSSPSFHISLVHRRDSNNNMTLAFSSSIPRSPSSSSVTSINDNATDSESSSTHSSNSSTTNATHRHRYFPFTNLLRPSKLSSAVTNSKHISNSNNNHHHVSQLSSQLQQASLGASIPLSDAPSLHAHTCCQVGQLIYVFAGSKLRYNISGTNEMYTFHTVTYEWKRLICTGDIPTARTFAPLVSYRLPDSDQYVLLTMGGQDRDINGKWSFFDSIYKFDIQTHEWKIVKYEPQHIVANEKQPVSYETPAARVGHRLTVIPSLETAYMFGGCYCAPAQPANNNNGMVGAAAAMQQPVYQYLPDFWSLDLRTYQWTNLTAQLKGDIPSARHSYEMCYLPYERPQLFLFGGNSDVYTAKNLNDCYLIDVTSLTCKRLALNCLVPIVETIRVNADGNDNHEHHNTAATQHQFTHSPRRSRSDSDADHALVDDVESPALRPVTPRHTATLPPLAPTTPVTHSWDAAPLSPSNQRAAESESESPTTVDVITSYEAKPHLPSSRWCANMAVISSYLIMCGGYRSRQQPSDFSLRHLYKMNWKSLCQSVYENKALPLPTEPIHYHSTDELPSRTKYDGLWHRHTVNQSIQARTFSSCTALSDQMLVIGGAIKGIPTNEVLSLL